MSGGKKKGQVSALIIDDTPLTLNLLLFVLEKQGMKVTAVDNGAAAIELARENWFDLIITDYHMPEMDGAECIRALRKLPSCASVPILALTADSATAARDDAKQSGANAIMIKPYAVDKLVETLDRLLSG